MGAIRKGGPNAWNKPRPAGRGNMTHEEITAACRAAELLSPVRADRQFEASRRTVGLTIGGYFARCAPEGAIRRGYAWSVPIGPFGPDGMGTYTRFAR